MQQYPLEKHYWEQNQSERALTRFKKNVKELRTKLNNNEGKELSIDEKAKIRTQLFLQIKEMKRIGDLETRTEKFRNKSKLMEERELEWEKHDSERLGRNLRLAGKAKPDANCQAHAIIAGNDALAGAMRLMLAIVGIRVDDAVNGVWLPDYEINSPHWAFFSGVCHAWLNCKGYHLWLHEVVFTRGFVGNAEFSDKNTVIGKLMATADILQNNRSKIPKSALNKKADTKKRKQNKI